MCCVALLVQFARAAIVCNFLQCRCCTNSPISSMAPLATCLELESVAVAERIEYCYHNDTHGLFDWKMPYLLGRLGQHSLPQAQPSAVSPSRAGHVTMALKGIWKQVAVVAKKNPALYAEYVEATRARRDLCIFGGYNSASFVCEVAETKKG